MISYSDFAALFPLTDDMTAVESVQAWALPAPYDDLLNHTHHMTVTVERFFGDRVNVTVDESIRYGDDYSRKILLKLNGSSQTVQLGVVKIRLNVLPEAVRDLILSESLPLGRILIENGVLTQVEPIDFVKVIVGPSLAKTFECAESSMTYGRIGLISANGQPAIEVLEVLRPIS